MSNSFLGRPLETSASYLDKIAEARAQTDARLRDKALTVGLRLLASLIDDVAGDLARRDLAEVALVYDALAEQLAEITEGPAEQIFPALVTLCQDPTASRLIEQLPAAPPEHVQALRDTILRLRTSYQAPRGGSPRRVIELIYRADGQPVARTIEHKFAWEDLPDDVRAQIIQTDQRDVVYQLYPRPA